MSFEIKRYETGYSVALMPNYLADPHISKMIGSLPGHVEKRANGWAIAYKDTVLQRHQLDKKVKALEGKIRRRIQEIVEKAAQQVGPIRPLPDLEVRLPLRRDLYPFQGPGIAYLLKHRRSFLADQPGLGKTTQAAAVMLAGRVMGETSTLPALIICPSTIKAKWQREIMAVTGLRAMVLTNFYKDRWPYLLTSGQVDAVIVNYESLKKYFVRDIHYQVDPETGKRLPMTLGDVDFNGNINIFKMVIVDEIHRCSDPETRQSILCYGITRGKEWILGLTGTPLVNTPAGLIPQLAILQRLRDFGGLAYFTKRYCQGGKGASNLEELNYRLTETCFVRRLKKDVLKDLPDKTLQVALCEIDNMEEYRLAEEKFEHYLKTVKACTDEQISIKLRGRFMVHLQVLREISARGKLQAIKEWGDNLLAAGEKIIIFCNLVDLVDRLKKIFPGALEITGRIDYLTRDRNVELFQSSPLHRVIICNLKAGAEGIDLFASSNVAFLEDPWTWANFEQCVDRAHRNGQKNAVTATSFIGEGTMDDFVHEKILNKKDLHDLVTGTSGDAEEIVDTLLNLIEKHKTKTPQLW